MFRRKPTVGEADTMYVKPFWILRVPFRRWWSACFKVSGGVCSFGLGCRRSRQIAALKSAGLRLKVQDSDDSVWDVIVSNLYGDLSFRVYVVMLFYSWWRILTRNPSSLYISIAERYRKISQKRLQNCDYSCRLSILGPRPIFALWVIRS